MSGRLRQQVYVIAVIRKRQHMKCIAAKVITALLNADKVICKLHFLQFAISVASPLRIVFAQLPTI